MIFHFFNCALLAFGPLVLAYRSSRLSEYGAFRTCASCASAYVLTQLVKIFVMASLLPSTAAAEEGAAAAPYSLGDDLLRAVVDAGDLAGFYFALTRGATGLHKYPPALRVLAVAVGWTFAESVGSYLVPLWIGARAEEFSWAYTAMAAASNVALVFNYGVVAAVWLLTRRDRSAAATPVAAAAAAAYVIVPVAARFATEAAGVPAWTVLGARAGLAAVLAVAGHAMVRGYEQREKRAA